MYNALTRCVGSKKELDTPSPTTMAATLGSIPICAAMETPRGTSNVQALTFEITRQKLPLSTDSSISGVKESLGACTRPESSVKVFSWARIAKIGIFIDTLGEMTILKRLISGQGLLGVLSLLLFEFSALSPRLESALLIEGTFAFSPSNDTINFDETNPLDCVRTEYLLVPSNIIEIDDDMNVTHTLALVASLKLTHLEYGERAIERFYSHDILSVAPKRSPTRC